MRTLVGILQRHGLTLLLTGALVYVFFASTLPALSHRDRLRRARAATERATGELRAEVLERELWLQGVRDGDPFVIERLQGLETRSPDIPGPRYVRQPPPEPQPAEEAVRGDDP